MTIVDEEKCCGCRACIQACSQHAIFTYNDKYGFERIQIDENKCINCGNCRHVCPILNPKKELGRFSCGSAYCKENNLKLSGSSGGLFGLFARHIIATGGIVYGAAFDEKLELKTKRAENLEQLDTLLKSKYLLCNTSGAFKSIKKDVDTGKMVLYCSSPCQIAALKRWLRQEYDNLLCVDFVCHGVGSQQQFNDSIRYIERKNNIKIHEFGFREKFKSASSHYYYYYYSDLYSDKCKKRTSIYMTFPYYFAYQERLTCRESCYKCLYATEERAGDITIGDFHEINRYDASIDRFAGVSMFVCNTQKGNDFFQKIRDKLNVREYDWDTIKVNNRFSSEEVLSNRRGKYLELLSDGKYNRAVKKFLNFRTDWRYYYYHAPKWLRDFGNKVLRS